MNLGTPNQQSKFDCSSGRHNIAESLATSNLGKNDSISFTRLAIPEIAGGLPLTLH